MPYLLSRLHFRPWRAYALTMFALAFLLQGCLINNGSDRGTIVVLWEPQPGTTCASLGISRINVVVARDGAWYGTFTDGFCALGSMTVEVGEGHYAIHAEGIAPNGTVVAVTPTVSVPVIAYAQVYSPVLTLSPVGSPAQTGIGGLSLAWSVLGENAATGCAKYLIDKLDITVLDTDQTRELQVIRVPCGAGQVAFSNLPTGAVYLRIDEANPVDTHAYGNADLAGPFAILSGQTTTIPLPIAVTQRTIVAVPVAFSGGGTCAGHGVGNVQYRISGNDKVIVPFSDADATKPCALDNATYAQHVIDLLHSPPTCAVPASATGLVICNAMGFSKLTVEAHGWVGGGVGYGAAMDILGLSDGNLTAVTTPLLLQPCGVADPVCL